MLNLGPLPTRQPHDSCNSETVTTGSGLLPSDIQFLSWVVYQVSQLTSAAIVITISLHVVRSVTKVANIDRAR